MIKHKVGIGGFVFMALLSVMECGKDPVSFNGTGSSTETAMVKGIVYNKDGSAAKNVSIYMRNKSYLANISSFLSKKSAAADMPLTKTDTKGAFSINYIDTGIYVLEATDGNNNVAINISVSIKSKDSTVTLPSDTLKPAGAIKGVVKLSNGADPRKVFVLAFGVDKFAKVNQDGTFNLANLAQGKYDVRLIPVIDNYDVFDTFNIPVKSADTTNLDTIRLAYSGVPKPTEVIIKYDPFLQNVTLAWNRPVAGLKVQSYTIFRKNRDSTNFVIIKNGVTDTTYIDSTGLPDRTYTYGVAAVDTNNTTGIMCASASTLIKTYFHVDTSFGTYGSGPGQFEEIASMVIDRNGNFYVTEFYGNSRIQVFNNAMQFQKMFASPNITFPYLIDLDSAGNIYTSDHGFQTIKKIAPGGTVTDSIMVSSGDTTVHDFCIHNNELFMVLFTTGTPPYYGLILVTDLHGNTIRSWPINDPSSIYINSSHEVFVTHTDSIQIFDTLGNIKSSMMLRGIHSGGKAVFDSKGRIISADQSGLCVFDSKGTMISRYNLQTTGNPIQFGPIAAYENFIYVGETDKILKISNLLP